MLYWRVLSIFLAEKRLSGERRKLVLVQTQRLLHRLMMTRAVEKSTTSPERDENPICH